MSRKDLFWILVILSTIAMLNATRIIFNKPIKYRLYKMGDGLDSIYYWKIEK